MGVGISLDGGGKLIGLRGETVTDTSEFMVGARRSAFCRPWTIAPLRRRHASACELHSARRVRYAGDHAAHFFAGEAPALGLRMPAEGIFSPV